MRKLKPNVFSLLLILMLALSFVRMTATPEQASSITSVATGTWAATAWPNTLRTGTITTSIASTAVTGAGTAFTAEMNIGNIVKTTGNVVIGTISSIIDNTHLTFAANAASTNAGIAYNVQGVGPGDVVTIATGNTVTFTGVTQMCAGLIITGTLASTAANDMLTVNGNLSGAGAIAASGHPTVITLSGNYSYAGTISPNNELDLTLNGTGAQTVTGTTLFLDFTVNKTSGTATLGTNLTMRGNLTVTNGTLDLSTFTANRVSGNDSIVVSNGAKLRIGGTNGMPTGYTVAHTFGITSTVEFYGTAQTLWDGSLADTFGNLTLSGSGIKTTTSELVAGILSIEGTAVPSAALAWSGTAYTLQYKTTDARTVDGEWTTPFAGTGGVIIANPSGSLTLNGARVFNTSIPLTINSGATLSTSASNFGLTFGGNFTNSGGTFTAGSSAITIANIMVAQSIAGFTTTGTVSMTKTAGTATFTGNVNGGALTINGSGGTLNLGTGLTHTFTGMTTLTAGTLAGGSSRLNENMVGTTAWNGTGTVFSAGTGTVNFGAAGNQTLSATTTTFNNLTLSGSGIKTFTNANTVNGILSIEGTATITGTAPTYGAAATLQYKESVAQTTGIEFPATFGGSGGVIINNASGVNLGSSVAITNGLTLTSGAFAVGANTLTLNGPTIGGTPANLSTTSASSLVFGGSSTGLNIPSSVTALNNLTINNANGVTLNSNLTINSTLTLTSGKITTGSNSLIIGAAGSISGGGVSSYINGNLRKTFNTGGGQAFTFPVGDASNYTPINIANMTIGTAGNLTASTTGGDHPNISTSGIDAAKSANRYWTLAPLSGLVATYDVTFNFVSTDLDAGSNTANFVVRRYSAATWSAPPGGSATGSTYTTGRGFTSFGDFAIGEFKASPTVTVVGLYQANQTVAATAMTPQIEYAVKVSVADAYTLQDLSSVVVTIYYDPSGTFNPSNIPLSGNTQTAAILTCTIGVSPSWSISPSANTTWGIVPSSSIQPNLAGTSGDFWFHFKPGKVATAANGKWYIYARAASPYGSGYSHQDNLTMNWYGEISVNTASVDFGTVAIGSDFSANMQSGISVTYICNSAYSMQVKLSSPWSGSGKTVTLNPSGSPSTGEFSVKANGTSSLGSAVVVSTSYLMAIGTGTQTGEAGVTSSAYTLWLKLGALGIPAGQYSGTIYYGIAP